jgi:DNA-binding response OmpR family regulator
VKLILIVDDMPAVVEPVATVLAEAGYETRCAADGGEALRVMDERTPDLVLLDVSMPVMDGLSVLRIMRRRPKLAAVPVILLTGASDKSSVVEAGKLGVRDYVLKSSFRLSELLARVTKYVKPGGSTPTRAADPREPAD